MQHSPAPGFRMTVEELAGVAVVGLSGELDMAGAPRVERELERVAGGDRPGVVVDGSELTFIDAAGLHSLLRGRDRVRAGGKVLVVVPSEAMRRVLALIELADPLVLALSQEQAVERAREEPPRQ